MSIDEDFAEFVAARWGSLYRLAYLLTASPAGAEDLLQTTLEKAYVNWSRIGRMEYRRGVRAPDARQHLWCPVVGVLGSGSSRRMSCPRPCGDSAEVPVLDRHLFWPLVCALPARQRAVIVLRYYEDLSEAQIADVLGCAPGTVKSQSSAAIGALRRALAASGIGEAVEES